MIKPDAIEKAVLGAASPQEKDIIRRVVVAGQQMLFDEKSHEPLFSELLGGGTAPDGGAPGEEGDVSGKLGNGIAYVLLQLYDKSRPGQKPPAEAAPVAPPAAPTGLINAQAPAPAPAQPAPPEAAPQPAKTPATMPKGVIVNAGTILLAKVAGFAGEAGLAQIDDATMNNALQAMFVKIYDRFDPSFRDRVAKNTGKAAEQTSEQQTPQPEQAPGGLLSAGA